MQKASAVSAGLFFILGIITLLVVLDMVKGGQRFRQGYNLKAKFNSVHELKSGDLVKQAGVEIGQVTSLKVVETNVEVTLRLNRHAEIHPDSVATIKNMGLFGQNYIGVTFGTPRTGKLMPGSFLHTEERPDFDQLISRIDTVASGFSDLNQTINQAVKTFTGGGGEEESPFAFLKDFVAENRGNISNVFANLDVVTTQIRNGEGTLGKLLTDDSLYVKFSETGENVNELVTSIRKGNGTVGKLMTDETLYRETTAAMTDMHAILNKINKGEGSIGKLVNDDSLIKNAKLTLQKLDKVSEGVEDQGPLSVIGIAAGALF